VLEETNALAVIPHRVSQSGHIIVETTLNGQGPFEFILDTGSSISVVYEKAARKTSLELVPGKEVLVLGMVGKGHYPVTHIDQVQVGGETWNDARVAILPDLTPIASPVDGILGLDFLRRYAIWYSHEDRSMRLYPRQLVQERFYTHWNSIALYDLALSSGNVSVPAISLFIDGVRVRAVLDLGANVNLMNFAAARSLEIPLPERRKRTEVFGAFGSLVATTELKVWRLQVGSVYWRRRTFLIGDFPVFDALDLERHPAALVGTDLFGRRDFVIDFERKRLLVKSRED